MKVRGEQIAEQRCRLRASVLFVNVAAWATCSNALPILQER